FEPNLAGCARTRHTARADPQAVAFLCCRLNCRCDIRRILSNDRRRTSPRVDALALPRSFPLEDSYQSVACLRTSTPFDSLPSLVLSRRHHHKNFALCIPSVLSEQGIEYQLGDDVQRAVTRAHVDHVVACGASEHGACIRWLV